MCHIKTVFKEAPFGHRDRRWISAGSSAGWFVTQSASFPGWWRSFSTIRRLLWNHAAARKQITYLNVFALVSGQSLQIIHRTALLLRVHWALWGGRVGSEGETQGSQRGAFSFNLVSYSINLQCEVPPGMTFKLTSALKPTSKRGMYFLLSVFSNMLWTWKRWRNWNWAVAICALTWNLLLSTASWSPVWLLLEPSPNELKTGVRFTIMSSSLPSFYLPPSLLEEGR